MRPGVTKDKKVKLNEQVNTENVFWSWEDRPIFDVFLNQSDELNDIELNAKSAQFVQTKNGIEKNKFISTWTLCG